MIAGRTFTLTAIVRHPSVFITGPKSPVDRLSWTLLGRGRADDGIAAPADRLIPGEFAANIYQYPLNKKGHRADTGNACNPITPDASEGTVNHFSLRCW